MRLFEKTPEAMTGSRIAAVDYAKTLAIVCVVMIHVSSEVLLGRQIGSAAWLEGLFWSSPCKRRGSAVSDVQRRSVSG